MIRSRSAHGRLAAILVSICAGMALLTPASAATAAGTVFATVDASTLVLRGTVEAVTPYEAAKLTVFRIRVIRGLKGGIVAGDSIDLAQEILFPTTRPYFAVGTETTILAVPLPNFSAFREVLPEGTYWRWSERLESADDVKWLANPSVTEAIARYLAVRDDGEKSADFLVAMLTGTNAALRDAALAAIGTRHEIVPLLDTGRLEPLEAWLRDPRQPLAERGTVMVRLAHEGAPGIADVAERLAGTEGPLQPAALDVLVTLGRLPAADRLLTWSRSADESLRLVACRGLVKTATPAALDRIAEVLLHDSSVVVRVAIVRALGKLDHPRAVPLLAGQMSSTEKPVMLAAADSLSQLATPDAIAALRQTLEKGSPDAQTAAAFALKRTGKIEADGILHETEQTHPDPAVRRLCKLALGESMHEH